MGDTPPPGIDLYADQKTRIIGSMVALIVLPTLFVIARLVSRKVSHAGYWWDDFWAILACVLCYIQCICVLISQHDNDFGKHIYVVPNPVVNTREFLKILYIYEVGYYSSVCAVKIAILAFYRRIFPVQQLKLMLYIGIGAVSTFYIGTVLATFFQCSPIDHFWNRVIPGSKGHCTNGDDILIVPGAINCVMDFIIIALPIPLLWRLRTTASQKGVLTGIFVCAGFVCIISILRLIVLSRLSAFDVLWNYVNSAIWSAAEPAMGVISACIPSLRPLFSMIIRGTTSGLGVVRAATKASAQDNSSTSSRLVWRSRSDDGREAPFTRLEDPVENRTQWGHDVKVKGGKASGGRGREDAISLEEMNVPASGIRVRDEVVVTSSNWIDYKDKVY